MKKERRNRPEGRLSTRVEAIQNPILTRRRVLTGLGILTAAGLAVGTRQGQSVFETLGSMLTEPGRQEVIKKELQLMRVEGDSGERTLWNGVNPEFMPIRIATKDGILNEA